MHCAHLRVNGEKMSKSLGNFFTLRDLIEKGWTGREIRYVLINAHYRSGLNFAFTALEDARKSLARIDACVETATEGPVPEWAQKHLDDFTAAVNDDLNIPKAFAALFELVRDTNGKGGAGTLGVFKRMDEVLGVIFFGNDRVGSAYETFGDYGVKVAAKTGTAQLGDNQVNNAIFICYAPYDNPKVAVAVVVEHGSAGASIASIARDFLDAYFTVKTVNTAPESELSLLQ